MKISVIASKKPQYIANKDEFENLSGHCAGVCYMQDNFDKILEEEASKTARRIKQTKMSGHHSVYDHPTVSLYLEDIPKALAIVLNNEKQYTTSEKSARYTKMILKDDEQKLYDKWLDIFKKLIKKDYQQKYPSYFTDLKVEKLAQENARYLISIFTPTSMVYSTTYRQLNNIFHMMQNEINKEEEKQNEFYKLLKPAMQDFCEAILKTTPYIDENINSNSKRKKLSLIKNDKIFSYFGDVYSINYNSSFAYFAQAQRHRTINYNINLLDKPQFYVPPILKNHNDLVEEWERDCQKQTKEFPQGMLISINEMGVFDDFVLKMMERKCSFAQLEINQQTNQILKEYVEGLEKINHPRAEEMKKYQKGARCTFENFKCTAPCGFIEGINETRQI